MICRYFDAAGPKVNVYGDSGTYEDAEWSPSREGYTFAGWALAYDGDVAYEGGSEMPVNVALADEYRDIHLYAVWQEN